MRVGGWSRLWIALSGIYAVVVIAVSVALWPSVTSISHHPTFIYRMSEAAQKALARPPAPTNADLERRLVDADKRGATEEARRYALEVKDRRANPWKESGFILEMPNRYEMTISADSPEEDQKLIGREYTNVLRSELLKERGRFILYAFLWWIGPVVVVCILGLLSRWVYLGFKKAP